MRMHQYILPPTKVVYRETSLEDGIVEIQGCYPGYGSTLGNSLRRVLLSSLEGAAIVSVKISGVQHEYSTLHGVMEDVVQILLNLKRVRFRMENDEPMKAMIRVKGEKSVTAKDIKTSTGLKVVNPDQPIATLTDKKSEIEMEIEVRRGLGYVPVEQQDRGEKEIGVIALDAIYTPVKRVNFEVENMRVGKRTDYDRVSMHIQTDGSLTPKEAFEASVGILVEQFTSLTNMEESEDKSEKKSEK